MKNETKRTETTKATYTTRLPESEVHNAIEDWLARVREHPQTVTSVTKLKQGKGFTIEGEPVGEVKGG